MAIYSLDEYGQPIVNNALSFEGSPVYGQVAGGRNSIVRPWKTDIVEAVVCAHPSEINVGMIVLNQVKPSDGYSRAALTYRTVEAVRALDGMSHPLLMYLLAEIAKVAEPIVRPACTLGRTLSIECSYIGDVVDRYRWKIVSEVVGVIDTRAISLNRILVEVAWAIHDRAIQMSRTCAENLILLEIRILEVQYLESLSISDTIDRTFARLLQDLVGLRERGVVRMPTRYLSQTIIAGHESITQTYGHICTETMSVADYMYKTYSLQLAERLRTLDQYSRLVARQFSETCHLGDGRIASVLLTFAETVQIAENRILDSVKDIYEAIRIRENRQVSAFRGFIDSITIGELRTLSLLRYMSETIQGVESRMISARKDFTEGFHVTEDMIRQNYREMAESMRLLDGKYILYTKTLNEQFALLEAQFALLNRILNESFRLLDSKAKSMSRTFLEPMYLSETRFVTFYYAEIFRVADVISKIIEVIKEEGVKTVDRKIRMPMKIMSVEVVSAVDDCTDYVSKGFSEAVLTADTCMRDVSKLCVELLKSVEARSSRVVFAVSDALHVSDVREYGIVRPLTEVLQCVDIQMISVQRTLSDSIRSLNIAIKRVISRDMNEEAHLSDVGVRMPWTVLIEALSVGDSLRRTLMVVKFDALQIRDKAHKSYSRILTEITVVGDALRKFKSLFWRYGSKVEQTTKTNVSEQSNGKSSVEQTTDKTEVDK